MDKLALGLAIVALVCLGFLGGANLATFDRLDNLERSNAEIRQCLRLPVPPVFPHRKPGQIGALPEAPQ